MIGYISSCLLMMFWLMEGILGICMVYTGHFYLVEWVLFEFMGFEATFVVMGDCMSFMFVGVVTFISSLVVLYSVGYMPYEELNWFITLVNLFVMSMVFVIVSPSLISILLGWDGLGLDSYCLVVYYKNARSESAGMITILSNHIGDIDLLIGIGWLFSYGSWESWSLLFTEGSVSLYVLIFILLETLNMSAQFPFSAWLPGAMPAPIPVSALVHSSTLVTAGIYLLIRFYPVYYESVGLMKFLLVILLLTMLLAGFMAMFEFDLKKIIALSTLTQLGAMMFSVSLGMVKIAFFHLIVHTLFKALLFLCTGKMIHDVGGNQVVRSMGGISFFPP